MLSILIWYPATNHSANLRQANQLPIMPTKIVITYNSYTEIKHAGLAGQRSHVLGPLIISDNLNLFFHLID